MLGNLPDESRCVTVKRDGERCKNPHLVGVSVCRKHGGNLPTVRAKSMEMREVRDMERLGIRPVAASHPEARGDTALELEIRRTIAWIEFCENQIEALGGPRPTASESTLAEALGGLQLTEEETQSGEERGQDTSMHRKKWSASVNTWEEKLRWNRHHLAGLTKQWIAAGFEARRLQLQRETLDVIERMQDGIVKDLGHNPRDPAVREIIKRRITEANKPREIES